MPPRPRHAHPPVPAAVAESRWRTRPPSGWMAGCAARAAQLQSGSRAAFSPARGVRACQRPAGVPAARIFGHESDALVCVCRGICGCVLTRRRSGRARSGSTRGLRTSTRRRCTPEDTAWLATTSILPRRAWCGGQEQLGRERGVAVLPPARGRQAVRRARFGHPEWDERKIKAPIVSQRRFKQRVAASGKSAETHAFVGARGTLRSSRTLAATRAALARAEDRAASPARLHLSHVGHPIVGDATYASDKQCTAHFARRRVGLPLQPPFGAAETYAPRAARLDVFEPSSPLRSPLAWPDAGARLAGELT